MDLDIAFLADAADVSLGKLFVLGGAFDTIAVPGFPATHPVLAVALRLLFTPHDLDRQHVLEILLLNADGKTLTSAKIPDLMVRKSADFPPGWKQPLPLALRFINIPFPQEGHYSIEILIDGTMAKAIPLRVVQQGSGMTI